MIQAKVQGTVLKVGSQSVDMPVEVEFAFDEENDPLAIQMIFSIEGEEEVCWVAGRELVMRGTCSLAPYGQGDVRFRAEPRNNLVLVCLNNPHGHADIGLARDELIAFLSETQFACKLGDEPLDELVDQELKEMFEA